MSKIKFFRLFLAIVLVIPLLPTQKAFLAGKQETIRLRVSKVKAKLLTPLQNTNIKILSPDGKVNPVVNSGNTLKLQVVDRNNQPVTGFTIESGSPNVVTIVDSAQGIIKGNSAGYGTITARRGGETSSTFVIVTKVNKGKGAKVLGQSDQDISGAIYLADPIKNQVFKVDDLQQPAIIYAGTGIKGKIDGERTRQAQFAGPIGISVDDRARNGIFIADTLNHSIRRIGFDNSVQTMLGTGSPGLLATFTSSDEMNFTNPNDITLSSPQGVAVDVGGNIFVADTDNHAIYFVDFSKSKVLLVAGQPGRAGLQDGKKRDALFNSPTSISLSPDGSILNVVDSGNNLIRQISSDGMVITLGSSTPSKNLTQNFTQSLSKTIFSEDLSLQSTTNQPFIFNKPIAVTQDLFGTIYVTDQDGVDVLVPTKNGRDRVSLAQPQGATFNKAASVNVRGTQIFVSDAAAVSSDEAFKIVTIGAPVITSMSRNSDDLAGGSELILKGENFGPESQVFVGDNEATDLDVIDANTIRLTIPKQKTPGKRTLTLQTRGGMDQKLFTITSKPVSQLIAGEITTIAGGIPFIGDGALAKDSTLFSPSSVAIDGMGNILIADENNNRIRKINTKSGIITSIAGNGAADFNGDKGPALVASLNKPAGLAVDFDGNIYIADRGNARVRKIDATTGDIDTIIGSGRRKIETREQQEGIDALRASIDPIALTVSPDGKFIFIADNANNRVRVFNGFTKQVFTYVGTGEKAFNGDGMLAKMATLDSPTDVVIGKFGLVIADFGNARVRLVPFTENGGGQISTIAGCGSMPGERCKPSDNSPATQSIISPISIDVSANGDLALTDTRTRTVRRVTMATGIINVIAGNPQSSKDDDSGIATDLRLFPRAIAAAGDSTLIIAEADNLKAAIGKNRIRVLVSKPDPIRGRVGFIDTIAGGAIPSIGDLDLATNASLNAALSLALDSQGNIFIADLGNRRVREITAFDRKIITVAGGVIFDERCVNDASCIGDNAMANRAVLFAPISVATDGLRLLIADAGIEQRNSSLGDSRIREVLIAGPMGTITTIAGGGQSFSEGVAATTAKIESAVSIAVDKEGNIFVLETDNKKADLNPGGRIRRIDNKTKAIQTIAGTGGIGSGGDGGLAINAQFSRPTAITLDKMGNIYIADAGNDRVRKIDAQTKTITTVIGGGTNNDEGVLATQAKLSKPLGVFVDDAGNIFVSDTASSRVRVVEAKTGKIRTVAGRGKSDVGGDGGSATSAGLRLPSGLVVDKDGNLYIADVGNSSIRAIKGPLVLEAKPAPQITSVTFKKSTLTINGMNFAPVNSLVTLNNRDVTDKIIGRTANIISLKGSKKKLGLEKKANNIVTITVDGVSSQPFIFNISKNLSDKVE
ncbi:MAG: IPT/TIG domain-containing protein [Acidobacteria bacterium]|nr:IPT/TIG domain-containing protein [Acidobacteriota bacterium]